MSFIRTLETASVQSRAAPGLTPRAAQHGFSRRFQASLPLSANLKRPADPVLVDVFRNEVLELLKRVVNTRIVRQKADLELRGIFKQLAQIPACSIGDRDHHRDMANADTHVLLRVGVEIDHDDAAGVGDDRPAEAAGIALAKEAAFKLGGEDVFGERGG